jgi:hypothetical protein
MEVLKWIVNAISLCPRLLSAALVGMRLVLPPATVQPPNALGTAERAATPSTASHSALVISRATRVVAVDEAVEEVTVGVEVVEVVDEDAVRHCRRAVLHSLERFRVDRRIARVDRSHRAWRCHPSHYRQRMVAALASLMTKTVLASTMGSAPWRLRSSGRQWSSRQWSP